MNSLSSRLPVYLTSTHHSILKPVTSLITSSRHKSPGQSQKSGRKRQWLGFTVPLGSFVHERDVFLKQRGLKFHPGLNAALDPRDNAIYALRDGVIAISTERFIPDMKNDIVEKHYVDYEGPMMIRYAHVIPLEQPRVFKLVELV
ncbi:39S ribosomal protein L27, mitochondrial [Tetranychus urticae]|uniref:39S ribosomal protein L27, mitochondrial n=1 Tax=Tetranychus urticae TaxID=32264 RepID=UPI000355F911|nr:39S ribosomal protein L27, mitochondrial [Tetranychus urticae]